MKCTLQSFGKEITKRVISFPSSATPEEKLQNLIKSILEVSKIQKVEPNDVEDAFKSISRLLRFYPNKPKDEEIKLLFTQWKQEIPKEKEDTSSSKLNNPTLKMFEKYSENIFDVTYGLALYAKIRAKLLASVVAVHSVLFNKNGIITSPVDLNLSIKLEQEKLLQNVINYLRTKVTDLDPSIFGEDVKMYKNGRYTGIVEKIEAKYGHIFKENTEESLMYDYNSRNFSKLDAFGSWIILNNYDETLQDIFGKAISINPDANRFSNEDKYFIAGGSNVYNTWRTSDEIDLSKEINNISLAIITSLSYIPRKTTTPSDRNLKFNEFTYIISKIKEIPRLALKDYIIGKTDLLGSIDANTLDELDGTSFIDLITKIRLNPLKYLPILFKLLNTEKVRKLLEVNHVITKNTFYDIDLDIINSLYLGLFNLNNSESLLSILEKTGYGSVNYFAFIGQTIDSIYKSNFLLYYRNLDGVIVVRQMYDLSISNIQFNIKDIINSINSKLYIEDYESFKNKYKIGHTRSTNYDKDVLYTADYEGKKYNFSFDKEGNATLKENGVIINDPDLLKKVMELHIINRNIPTDIYFTIEDFHAGPLTVNVNLTSDNGDITYSINGNPYTFKSKKDYDSLSDLIQNTLKQNFQINDDYFLVYTDINGSYSNLTQKLMRLTSRVIANLYISNEILEGYITRSEIKTKLNQIFGERNNIKPSINKKTKEISFVVNAEEDVLSELALAQAIVTGRLTSSQILDGEGNALSSQNLSRLMSTLDYQVFDLVRDINSASRHFSLWNFGVFKGISLLKEFKDSNDNTSKSLTSFSAREMETAAIFLDFVLGLLPKPKTGNSPIGDGIIALLPSENSDKNYIGRMFIDLNEFKLPNGQSLYSLLKTDFGNISQLFPIIFNELGDFYRNALDKINQDWLRVNDLIDSRVLQINQKIIENQQNEGREFNVEELIESSEFMPISYGKWEYINLVANKLGMSPLELVNDVITEYNNSNPRNPIVLIDLVHYVSDSNGNLNTNTSFIANLKRFSNLDSFYEFIYKLNVDVIKTLLKDKVDIVANDQIRQILSDDWIDPLTGKVILARMVDDITGEELKNIRRKEDFTPSDEQEVTDIHSGVGLEINPLIRSYNILNYFFTLEFMNSTVGAFYAHPVKGSNLTELLDEKGRKVAQDKRNVSFTAAMHPFLLNLIQGVPPEINIAIMPDVHDIFQTISGDEFSIEPFDGATFENPWFGLMENASLCGAKVGLNKKTFVHYYDHRTGTGGIIKTANFYISNYNIRDSKFYLIMILNMTDRVWKNLDGTDYIINELTDYNGNPLILTNPNDIDGKLYFQLIEKDNEGNNIIKYYRILKIEVVGPNKFKRLLQEVDINGNELGDEGYEKEINPETNELQDKVFDINTNYKLWKFLGGEYSMELLPEETELSYSEHSILLMFNIINSIGTKNVEGKVRYLSDIYQPLKHSDIHIMPTIGAVKQGAGNINTEERYRVADASKINFMRIKMNQAGILLDKEHKANGEDLSIMSQVISACAARGYTHEYTQRMYNALASLARAGIREHLDAFKEFFENPNGSVIIKDKNNNPIIENNLPKVFLDSENNPVSTKNNYLEVILDTLLDAFLHASNPSDMVLIATRNLIEKAKLGQEITFKDKNSIPFSDSSIFRQLHSAISVALTRAGIKIKVDGILSVLCPSFNIKKLYNGKTLSSFRGDMSKILLEQDLQDNSEEYELINSPSKIQIGRTYKMKRSNGEIVFRTIKTHSQYYAFRQYIKNNPDDIISIREQFAPEGTFEGGRELASYNATFSEKIDPVSSQVEEMKSPSELRAEIDSYENFLRELQLKTPRSFNFYDLSSVKRLADLKTEYKTASSQRKAELLPLIKNALLIALRDLMAISGKKLHSNIIITGDPTKAAKVALLKGGINVLRLFGTSKHFGNPFTHRDGIPGTINVGSVKNATEAFEAWLRGDTQYNGVDLTLVEPERRAWIIEQINSGVLKGLPIIYYTDKIPDDSYGVKKYDPETAPNHAHILLKLINNVKDIGLSTIDGNIKLDLSTVDVQAYEVIMPKVFADQFGLRISDDLNAIKEDKDFFVKRLLERIDPRTPEIKESCYTLSLLRLGKGLHVYLLNPNDAVEDDNFKKKTILVLKDGNKIWRIKNNEKVYEMKKGDEVWEYTSPSGKRVEVIVTKNFSHYLHNLEYNTIRLSENTRKNSIKRNNIFTILYKNDNISAISDYLLAYEKALADTGDDQGHNLNPEHAIISILNIYDIEDLKSSPIGDYFLKLGRQIHSSFLKSLEVVAARIPALSMQSFMPMKVVAFEGPDINTAYVSTTQFLFLGSDLDIDAVSLASFAFSKSGKYILHSPFANIETFENLKASERLPFPTGISLSLNENAAINYGMLVAKDTFDPEKPFYIIADKKGKDTLRVNTSTPRAINLLEKFLLYCNLKEYIPTTNDEQLKPLISKIVSIVNRHNNYIYDESSEKFARNYVVTTMFDIGSDPANLIESLLAMDSITKDLIESANSTIKAKEVSVGNVGNYTTNIHGIVQNMSGKSGVGICAVGLKTYFGLTARYNEVLNNGTEEEQKRLLSKISIAGRNFVTLSNIYPKEDVNNAIAQVVRELLDLGTDQALVLSALLSLAVDNAKELALDKLNAENFLGMYIFGISIGMDFRELSRIICSQTGLTINGLIKGNVFTLSKDKSIESIYDYLELGPKIPTPKFFTENGSVRNTFAQELSQQALHTLAWENAFEISQLPRDSLQEELRKRLSFLELLKQDGEPEFNRAIEEAQDYVKNVFSIITDFIAIRLDGQEILRHTTKNEKGRLTLQVYEDFKTLLLGGEELRRQGLLLHINQGLESSYADQLNYIETLCSTILDRAYSEWRHKARRYDFDALEGHPWTDKEGGLLDRPKYKENPKLKIDFSEFVFNPEYRNEMIDEYEKHKVFFNILDTMLVPHYLAYLEEAAILHQDMMKISVKYRTIYSLGVKAIELSGAKSKKDKLTIFRKTELFVDNLMRDRYLISKGRRIRIPKGGSYFKTESGQLIKVPVTSSSVSLDLGTREGNASFKLLMETKIIPDLLKGLLGDKSEVNNELRENLFIRSLSPTLYSQNPEQTVTMIYAPNINMSPRSDSDKALFEKLKYDFNKLKQFKKPYKIDGVLYDIVDLFYIYNLISTGNRVGENTMTSIFKDSNTYGVIADYKNYIISLDDNLDFYVNDTNSSIDINDVIAQLVPKGSPWSSKLRIFMGEDLDTGNMSIWRKEYGMRGFLEEGFDGFKILLINDFLPSVLSYATNDDLKNYIVTSQDTDKAMYPFKLEGLGQANITVIKGKVLQIAFYPLDANNNPDISKRVVYKFVKKKEEEAIVIPKDKASFFRELPTKVLITSEGTHYIYDVDKIGRELETLIKCG